MQKRNKSGYVAYYRVSTKQQGRSGFGLEAQREAVTRFAGKLPILAEYTEVESGKNHTKRPQLLAALKHAKHAKACLLIATLDRLARNVHFISGLLESKVDFVCCDNPHANKTMLQMMAVFAEHEREMISERTKAGLAQVKAQLKEKGFRISTRGNRFTKLGSPNWQEAILKARKARHPATNVVVMPIDAMRKYRLEGASLRAIAGRLNASGVKTRTGHVWYASTVRQALKKQQSPMV